ncbi:MAG: addiction module protein [Fimbriiglobus sp.]|jgi:putative addiction module component (TIGR02574 family)|nr:addiction module protein [Fimbriiglobus sp.]
MTTATEALPIDLAPILALTVEQRTQLIQAIWDSLPDDPEGHGLSDELKAELDRRLEKARANPNGGVPAEQVIAAALARSAARRAS